MIRAIILIYLVGVCIAFYILDRYYFEDKTFIDKEDSLDSYQMLFGASLSWILVIIFIYNKICSAKK